MNFHCAKKRLVCNWSSYKQIVTMPPKSSNSMLSKVHYMQLTIFIGLDVNTSFISGYYFSLWIFPIKFQFLVGCLAADDIGFINIADYSCKNRLQFQQFVMIRQWWCYCWKDTIKGKKCLKFSFGRYVFMIFHTKRRKEEKNVQSLWTEMASSDTIRSYIKYYFSILSIKIFIKGQLNSHHTHHPIKLYKICDLKTEFLT